MAGFSDSPRRWFSGSCWRPVAVAAIQAPRLRSPPRPLTRARPPPSAALRSAVAPRGRRRLSHRLSHRLHRRRRPIAAAPDLDLRAGGDQGLCAADDDPARQQLDQIELGARQPAGPTAGHGVNSNGVGMPGAADDGVGTAYAPPCSQGPGAKTYTFTLSALSALPTLSATASANTGAVVTAAISGQPVHQHGHRDRQLRQRGRCLPSATSR